MCEDSKLEKKGGEWKDVGNVTTALGEASRSQSKWQVKLRVLGFILRTTVAIEEFRHGSTHVQSLSFKN